MRLASSLISNSENKVKMNCKLFFVCSLLLFSFSSIIKAQTVRSIESVYSDERLYVNTELEEAKADELKEAGKALLREFYEVTDFYDSDSESYSEEKIVAFRKLFTCLLYTSPSPRDATLSRMPSSA